MSTRDTIYKYEENKWKAEWSNQIIFSNRSSNSNGAAIVFPNNQHIDSCIKFTDNNSIIIATKNKIDTQFCIPCNFCAHTQK